MFHCSVIKVLCCCRLRQLVYFIILFCRCQELLFIFLKFLSSRESVLSCSNCYILPQLLQLVNNFFYLFYFFLISLLPRDQCLPILSSCSAFVNGVFHIFSIFFCTLFFPLFNPQIRTFSFHDFLNPERILPSFLPAGKLSSS